MVAIGNEGERRKLTACHAPDLRRKTLARHHRPYQRPHRRAGGIPLQRWEENHNKAMKYYKNKPRLAGRILLTWVCSFKRSFDVTVSLAQPIPINTVSMPQPTHIPLCRGLTEMAVYPCFRRPAAWHLQLRAPSLDEEY